MVCVSTLSSLDGKIGAIQEPFIIIIIIIIISLTNSSRKMVISARGATVDWRGLKSGIDVRKMISTLKKGSGGDEWLNLPPKFS